MRCPTTSSSSSSSWIAALAGLRKGEMLALARRHIDPATSTIRVERALLEVRGQGAVFAEPKSAAGVRTVTMPDTLAAVVDEHLDRHVAEDPDALLFTNGHGNPIRASVWTPAWAAARKSAGVDVRLHDLRHLAGTLTAQAGATLRETMDRSVTRVRRRRCATSTSPRAGPARSPPRSRTSSAKPTGTHHDPLDGCPS